MATQRRNSRFIPAGIYIVHVLASAVSACAGGEAGAKRVVEAPHDSAVDVKAMVPSQLDDDDAILTKALTSYDAAEFWATFAEKDSGGKSSYGDFQRQLLRNCETLVDECRINARASYRSLQLAPPLVPENGVVVALYRPASRKELRRETGYWMRQDKNVKGYFLVVLPPRGSDPRARWRMIGIVKSPGGQLAFDEKADRKGYYVPCDSPAVHLEPRAGFEPCTTLAQLHAQAERGAGAFDSLLMAYRDTVDVRANQLRQSGNYGAEIRGVLGGPYDLAWTTCAAGCCRAMF